MSVTEQLARFVVYNSAGEALTAAIGSEVNVAAGRIRVIGVNKWGQCNFSMPANWGECARP